MRLLLATILVSCVPTTKTSPTRSPPLLFPSTGQSNSIGGGQQSALSLASAHGNWKVAPRNDLLMGAGEPTTGCEDRGNTETHATAMADKVSELTGRLVVVSNSGEGSAPMSAIRKGGTGCAYAHSLGSVRAALDAFPDVQVPGVVLIHGDSDAQDGTTDYDRDLLDMQVDYDHDIRAINAQHAPVRLYITQFREAGTPEQDKAIKDAQRRAAELNPLIVIVGDLAELPYILGSPHLTNVGYRMLGEMIGRAIAASL